MTTIVILGASYGGVSTAHRLLKATTKTPNVKIILVSPNTHLYWNIAGPRAIVSGQLPDDKIFQPINPGVGSAKSLDVDAKNVVISGVDGDKALDYDILILATGSRTKGDVPFKMRGSYEETRDAVHDFRSRVGRAASICIVSAGATGVELAGELAFEFGTKKKITLIASGDCVLEGTPERVSKSAMNQLQNLQVDVNLVTKVIESSKIPDGSTELELSGGKKMTTDLYLPTVGLVPNSSYIPSHLLNEQGFVKVDEYLRVKGAKAVWAVGDISDIQRPQYANTEKQSVHLAKNIRLVLLKKEPVRYSTGEKDMMAVPIGRKSGTGHMGGIKLPGFLVNMAKGKTLFTEKLPGVVSGSAF